MLADKLVERDNYLESISYIKNTKITEYDIKSAGFNIIREFNLVNEETLNHLCSLEKIERTIQIGKLMRANQELNVELTKKFAEVRKMFVVANNIQEEDILSIKKDAIFLIQKQPKILKFGTYLEFVPKNVYTSFIFLNGMEFYYDSYHKKLDVKNFRRDFDAEVLVETRGEKFEVNIDSHPMIADMKNFIALSEKVSQKDLFNSLKRYRAKYISRELPLETYREINSGLFTLIDNEMKLKFITEDFRDKLDISFNFMHFLAPFLGILL